MTRLTGAAAGVGAVAVALTASTYEVGFYTDPIGARGLPYLSALLLAAGGGWLLLRPGKDRAPPAVPSRNATIVVAGLVGYAIVLPVFGFLVATSAVMIVLGRAFGAPLGRSVVLGAGYTVLLFLLFATLLGLPLPVGAVFIRPM